MHPSYCRALDHSQYSRLQLSREVTLSTLSYMGTQLNPASIKQITHGSSDKVTQTLWTGKRSGAGFPIEKRPAESSACVCRPVNWFCTVNTALFMVRVFINSTCMTSPIWPRDHMVWMRTVPYSTVLLQPLCIICSKQMNRKFQMFTVCSLYIFFQ